MGVSRVSSQRVAVLRPGPSGRPPNPGCGPGSAAPSSPHQPDLPLRSDGMGRASGPQRHHREVRRSKDRRGQGGEMQSS